MTKYYKIPFGSGGDRATIPATDPGDGAVNYTEGYGPDYSLPRLSDPDALNIERDEFNQLIYDITLNIQQYQQHGVPEFITNADNGGVDFPYSKGAVVRYNNGVSTENYMSLSNSNTALPTNTTYWLQVSSFGTMALQNANAVAITGGTITGMPSPTNPSDVVNKSYVDAIVAGLSPKASCRLATAAAITGTYSNGTSGVGATITYTATGAISIDGVTPSAGDRVLVKNQASTFQNGIYSVTTVGSGGVSGVLTRTSDYDTSAEVFEGTYTIIEEGTANAGTLFIMTTNGTITIGTTAIVFTQLSSATASIAAQSLLANVTGSTAAPGAYTPATSKLVGKTAAGQLGDITLGTNLSLTGATLNAAGGGGVIDAQVFTASGTWTKPGSGTVALIQVISGGGAGGSRSTTGNVSGGASGSFFEIVVPLSKMSATETVVVGASAAGVSGNSSGTAGNDSSITIGGVTGVYVLGGQGGNNSASGADANSVRPGYPNGSGGPVPQFWPTNSGTDPNPGLYAACSGGCSSANVPKAGGDSPYGPGGGGGSSSTAGGTRTGGVSATLGNGGAGGANTGGAGTGGSTPGGGGGGAVQGGTSGAGARGEVRVYVM